MSDPRRHVDLVAVSEGDHRLLPVRALARLATKQFDLALRTQRVHGLHLDLEQGLYRRLDLRLGGIERHLEGDLIVLGSTGRLLGDHRRQDHVVMVQIAHFRRASRASTAALVRTRVSRRRMSYTLAPCSGSTSTLRSERTARAKFSSTVLPSITSALSRPSPLNLPASSLVLPAESTA